MDGATIGIDLGKNDESVLILVSPTTGFMLKRIKLSRDLPKQVELVKKILTNQPNANLIIEEDGLGLAFIDALKNAGLKFKLDKPFKAARAPKPEMKP